MTGRLRAYLIVTSALGFAALLGASVSIGLHPAIALRVPGLPADAQLVLGVAYWSFLTLLAAAMSLSLPTGGVLLFIAMPLVASMIVGGPAATVWVAALGTTELRELRGKVPWYGTISNHTQLVLAALAGALVFEGARTLLGGSTAGVIDGFVLLATLLGGGTYLLVDVLVSARTAALRTGEAWRALISMLPGSYWASQAGVVLLAWLMAEAYTAIGWWAPLLVLATLLTVWRAFDVDTAHWAAAHDPLTDLVNRREFREQLEHVSSRLRRGSEAAALLIVDLDGFKAVNDRMGHAAGDEVLRITARRLRQMTRQRDVLGRLGGDEFGVLLTGLGDPAAAHDVAARIERTLSQPINLPAATVVIGASVGTTLIDPSQPDASAILDAADRAMYRVKHSRAGAAQP